MIEVTIDKAVGPAAIFASQVIEPLEAVLGRTLLAVSYWILDSDQGGFSAGQPNRTGILVVRLHFEGATIEIIPGWHKQLRSEGIYHHIQVVLAGQWDDAGAINSKGSLVEIAEIHHDPWQAALGQRLTGAEVSGFHGTPQALRLSFSDRAVVMTVGYAGSGPAISDLLVGDGDELSIFSAQEWQHQMGIAVQNWEGMWTGSAASYGGLPVHQAEFGTDGVMTKT